MSQVSSEAVKPLTLREAAYRALKIMGINVLQEAPLFTSCVLDLMADDNSITNVLERNCDNALLRFYWPVLQNPTESMLDDCMRRAAVYLEHDHMLQQNISKQIAAELGFAIGLYLHIPCSDELRMLATGTSFNKEGNAKNNSGVDNQSKTIDSKNGEDASTTGSIANSNAATIQNTSGSSVTVGSNSTAINSKVNSGTSMSNTATVSNNKKNVHNYFSIGAGIICYVSIMVSLYNYGKEHELNLFLERSSRIFVNGNILVAFLFLIALICILYRRGRSLMASRIAELAAFGFLIVPIWAYAEWLLESLNYGGMFLVWPSNIFESTFFPYIFLALCSLVYFVIYAYRCKLLSQSQP